MRIDPVYLVAPKPPEPSMPTRRAFVFMGAAFAVGSAFGGACGYSVGARAANAAASGEPQAPADEPLKSTGNAELDELRRLAVKAPIEELLMRSVDLFAGMSTTYREDAVLWQGIERLCEHVIKTTSFDRRRITARSLEQMIERANSKERSKYEHWLPKLRQVR
jgi:hypothetical protein